MKFNKTQSLLFLSYIATRRFAYSTLGAIDCKILKQANPISILTYHSVASDGWRFSIDLKTMKQQISYLKSNYQFISLKTVKAYIDGKITLTTPSIVLTFDDGHKNILQLKDFLKEQNIQPALFLLADAKNVNASEIGIKSSYLNKKEIKSLILNGWEIGCHSNTHADFSKLSPSQLKKEIILAKKNLEKSLGRKINYFAYPKGKYSKEMLRYVSQAKYSLGLTMEDGFIKEKINPLIIPRIGIDRTHSFSEFKSAFSPSTIRVRKIIKSTFVRRYL